MGNLNRSACLTLFFIAKIAIAQSFQESDIISSITGNASTAEKKEIAELFSLFAKISQTPQQMNLETVVAATGVRFLEPICSRRTTGVTTCAYQNPLWDVKTFSVSNLRTFTSISQPEFGGDVRMQIAQNFACIPPSAIERFWGVKPIKGPSVIPDSFADNRKLKFISIDIYRGFNLAAPYVYVETKSIEGCVVDISLSAVPPSLR